MGKRRSVYSCKYSWLVAGALMTRYCKAAWGETTAIKATDPRVKWVGRTLADNESPGGGVLVEWPGTTARLTLQGGTRLDVWIKDSTPAGTRFGVYADGAPGVLLGQRIQTIHTTSGRMHYTLLSAADLLSQNDSITVELVHLQEAGFILTTKGANVTIEGFETDSEVVAPPEKRRRLEFIGDSQTAGYGSAWEDECQGSIYTNDHTLTYAHRLCQDFEADCFVEAISGIGMACSLTWNVADMYDCPNNATMPGKFYHTMGSRLHGPLWDFTEFVPDAVVINLGTNDFCCNKILNATYVKRYEDTYTDFVTSLADRYGSVHFFLAVGAMTDVYALAVKHVVKRLQDEKGIAAHYLDVFVPRYGEPWGCQNHPSVKIHARMAELAKPQIAAAMGWDLDFASEVESQERRTRVYMGGDDRPFAGVRSGGMFGGGGGEGSQEVESAAADVQQPLKRENKRAQRKSRGRRNTLRDRL